ncbi:MAG: hypothetical protein ACKOX3_00895 [Bacteroidota bacterium]
MDHLQTLIGGMTKEELRYYKLFTSRTTHEHDRKDLKLFNEYRKKGELFNEEKVWKKIYPEGNKNAWYRIKHRLLGDINKSLTLLHYEENDFMVALHTLSLYHFYSQKNKLSEARYYLRKAEKIAQQMEHNELLDIIYGEYIQLSYSSMNINPEPYLLQRKEIRKKQEALREIDDLLAVITYQLKTTQNLSRTDHDVLSSLQKNIDTFINNEETKKSATLQTKVYQAVSKILLQRHEYVALEKYLLKTYKYFEKNALFTKGNHDTKLQMLTYLVNSLFKNDKSAKSLHWAETLKEAMEEYNHLLYDKYFFFYYNALVINYSSINPIKAIDILENLRENTKIKTNDYYIFFVYLNLAVLRFDNKEYKEAGKLFTKISMLEWYKSADDSLKLKITVCELITRYQMQQLDVLVYKLEQTSRSFKSALTSEENKAEKEVLALLKKLERAVSIKNDKNLVEKIHAKTIWMRKEVNEETYIINYENWLESLLR